MKTLRICAFAFLAAAVVRGAPFEGKIVVQRGGGSGQRNDVIVCSIKGDKIRVDALRENITSYLTDTTKRETTTILEDDRAYVVVPSLAPPPDAPPPDMPKFEETGETRKLLGYPVRKYLTTSDEGTIELWLAEGFGVYTGFGEGTERPREHIPGEDVPDPPDPMPWEQALAGQPLFPLLVITRDGNGRETYRVEAKEITPQPLPDGLFNPPSNYKKLKTWPDKRVEV